MFKPKAMASLWVARGVVCRPGVDTLHHIILQTYTQTFPVKDYMQRRAPEGATEASMSGELRRNTQPAASIAQLKLGVDKQTRTRDQSRKLLG